MFKILQCNLINCTCGTYGNSHYNSATLRSENCYTIPRCYNNILANTTHVEIPREARTDSPEHLYNPEFQHPIIMMFLDYNKNYSGICGLGAIDANFGGRFNTRVYRVEIRCTGCDWRSCKIFSCSSQSLSKFACKPILWLVQYGHH